MLKPASLTSCFILILTLVLTVLVYSPGLDGGFLFDDYPNLQDLGAYGGVTDLETFKSFVFNGWSGPTGRPIAMASFLLDDNTWPSQGAWFKDTNLKIHLLVGLLICWSSLHLLRLHNRSESEAVWIALITTSIWLLHPYLVSTTLYVVQRMAQLAALFMMVGITGFLYGRLLLSVRPKAAYLWMSLSIGLGTLFALFSKENGVLLPLLILVIEFCLPTNLRPLSRVWKVMFLWLPSAVIVVALASKIDFSPDAWPTRTFTQPERLLTEPRIIWEYLYHLYVPRIEGRGLFQDGYAISRGWLNPTITIFAVVSLVALFLAALLLRKRLPLLSLAVLFFFAAHLVESTVIGLELYFEHRNYVAAAFLFLPLAGQLVTLANVIRPYVVVLICAMILLLLAGMTWQRANLWSDSNELELYWASATPDSPRAQNTIAAMYYRSGKVDEAMTVMAEAVARLPDSGLLTMRLLLQKTYEGMAVESDFVEAGERLAVQPFDAQAVKGVRTLVDYVAELDSDHNYIVFTLNLIGVMGENEEYSNFPLVTRLLAYAEARLLLAQGHITLATKKYEIAMDLYGDTDAALSMVAEMAQAGHFQSALHLLKHAKIIYRDQDDGRLKRSRAVYDFEIERLENTLQNDLKNNNLELSR